MISIKPQQLSLKIPQTNDLPFCTFYTRTKNQILSAGFIPLYTICHSVFMLLSIHINVRYSVSIQSEVWLWKVNSTIGKCWKENIHQAEKYPDIKKLKKQTKNICLIFLMGKQNFLLESPAFWVAFLLIYFSWSFCSLGC